MMHSDRQLQELFANNRIIKITSPGGKAGDKVWFKTLKGRVQGTCANDVAAGEAIALLADTGEWWLVNTQPAPESIATKRTIEYRQTFLKKSFKYAGGLLASTNNYITGNGEGKLMANLIAQLFHDTNSWNNPSKKKKRYIACLIGPTYTPLEPIKNALLEWNYICENVPDTKKETLKKYDGLIARVVKVPELPFIFGENVEGIASMLKAGKIVYLGGCGCPFGSKPFNDILNRLGFSWTVRETRSLSESQKPQVVYPWVVQINLKAGINETRDYVPEITDRTVFSNVKKTEAIVKSTNGQVMMAYSPYPDCLKYLKNLNP